MFTRIGAKGYRCLKEVSQELRPFEILVGSNASGKSTFLDVMGFVSDLVGFGLGVAVERRTGNFHDLVWGREDHSFTFNLQVQLPHRYSKGSNPILPVVLDNVSYGVSVELDSLTETLSIAEEHVDLLNPKSGSAVTRVVERVAKHLRFVDEQSPLDEFKRIQRGDSSSLTTVPDDEQFPATAGLREFLEYGILTVVLEARDLANPSPPEMEGKRMTGANLARQVSRLKEDDPPRYQDWLADVQTALPDICKIDSVLKEENRHRYVVIEYKGGVRVPSWMLSEGTLRLLALTVLAYIPSGDGVYLIEEPETGVHPTALETIYQSLSSIYEAQVLVASHSPVLLSMAKPEQILCFSKTPDGTKIVRGSEHPALKEWQGEVSLGTLAASGILG